MKIYTYSEARKNFSHLFSAAMKEGIIHIKSKEGILFSLIPGKESPLDVPSIDVKLSRNEILDMIHESRERR